ncbi:hypothetical protein GLOIN_2v1767282 [Rhizophagus irregularis DAOM 181602=DAOM 197198]|uniref:F-box domain-containing protein n=3 Tax=Rhizophagus irregularis TaxID=588596 RepID=A0A015M6X5_RHIIW|nr:hypothetical protein GLOIN_2v1767282 [Rhizophagus irregularis DAOM 181602=DAOM 197198]EXX62578.1 hypothetical protein RirG_160480 [Rhizophagus irregularis DAOM 197198w]POG77963.1 hypothetical protein GLOIN_2v1767282 [Rhizophagus irregularis DAOM 181602=DAOM 197198]GBC46634.1 hypothetical protein GLOIN_2v1767282 [Rhizophagus irregularis DAOM 181602=DAOM 197198]|eukprot:XP_025184829.1 hypothetical protein GLOIN_2v1767282 [Rhizophagus irregularis DAOM 181602=DAOM 197198]
MACSKVFSGDLPELTDEIMQYLRKDLSTLYSCIFVNRLWCRLAIPLLWEDPFLIPNQHYRCIGAYLSFLNEDSKAKFNEYGIDDKLLLSNTLFNYPSFIKYFDTYRVCRSASKWVVTLIDECNEKLEILVYRYLIEVIIENEGNLNSFEVVLPTDTDHKYFNDNMDLILQNPNFTCNISNLRLYISDESSFRNDIIKFFKFLYSNCNSISSIFFKFFIHDRSLIEKDLSEIIISQHNLKKITYDFTFYNLLSLKDSNCSNTLNTIIFYNVDFKYIVNDLQEVFDQLNVLESIHIIYCLSLNSDFVKQIIKVNKPFKLRSLFLEEILHIESLQLLIEMFSNYLENIGFGLISHGYNEQQKRQLFKLIMKYCTKIRYFNSGIPDDNIYQFIENNQHFINYITIEIKKDYDTLSSNVLQNLGQVLPSKLEYLRLKFLFKTSDLEIFLKNSQNTFIKKLIIGNIMSIKGENILFYIKEYIMKKERVKYLAIVFDDELNNEIFHLKDEVNEFKLHNIIVKRFSDLYIDAYNFVNDLNK